MKFAEWIKQLHEPCQIPQRKLATALDIDTATYCKYKKGLRPKREQVIVIAELQKADYEKLLI